MRTNLIHNPSFEANYTDFWSAFSSAGTPVRSIDATNSQFGTSSYKHDCNGVNNDAGLDRNFTLTPGIYRLSAYVKTQDATGDAKVVLRNRTNFNADINLTLSNAIASRPWTRVTGTYTVASTDSFDVIIGIGAYGAPGQGIAWFDGIMLEVIANVADDEGYFDGDTTDTSSFTYAWTGTPHNSTSTETEVTSNIKKASGVAQANLKKVAGVAIANIESIGGIDN